VSTFLYKLAGGAIVVLLTLLYITHLQRNEAREHAAAVHNDGMYRSEVLAHAATVANYRAATAAAKAADEAHARAEEQRNLTRNIEVSRDYQTKLADLRGRYDALRLRPSGTPAADPRGGGGAGLPGAGQGSAGAAGTAGEAGFPAAGDLTLDDRFICSAQAEQLDALITWVERTQAAPQ
jgi:hypothetical protein